MNTKINKCIVNQYAGGFFLFLMAVLLSASCNAKNSCKTNQKWGRLSLPVTRYTGKVGWLHPRDTTVVTLRWPGNRARKYQIVLSDVFNAKTVSLTLGSIVDHDVHTLSISERAMVKALKTLGFTDSTGYDLLFKVVGTNKKDVLSGHISLKSATMVCNPVYSSAWPDPSWMRDGNGRFYVVSGSGILSTADFKKWTYQGQMLSASPSWLPGGAVWAGELDNVKGKYYLYYAGSNNVGDGWKTGIGVATADRITGPYRDHDELVNARKANVMNSIDPCFYNDGRHKYIFWGSAFGIWAYELTDDGLSIKPGTGIHQITVDTYDYNHSLLEGTMIHKHGEYYYLFASIGATSLNNGKSTYAMVVVRSKNILGPYVDKKGRSILKGTNYEIINQGNSRFSGPGHNSEIITDDDGNDWVLYHAYDLNRSSPVRTLMLSQVKWVDGWPVIHNGTPPAITETPYFKTARPAPVIK
jgi:hypothetical protein